MNQKDREYFKHLKQLYFKNKISIMITEVSVNVKGFSGQFNMFMTLV